MKKFTVASLAIALPLMALSFFTHEGVAKKPIYLHEQTKSADSSQAHLDQFASNGKVIIDFYADWCNPCKRMSPLIDNLAEIMPEFTFLKINRDIFLDLAKTFNITSIPTLIFLHNGKEIGRYDGKPLTQKALEQLIRKIYQNR